MNNIDNPQDWLDELYCRCDLSNNRTENPVARKILSDWKSSKQ